jgi:TRAP-type C4-dicarboxylate transport system permease small subunit
MRRLLDGIYRASGVLAAVFLFAICAVVLLQVGANLVDTVADRVTGEPIGLVIPSYADFAGFFLVAASFLALAPTLRTGGHIRVCLIIEHLGGARRRAVELWCTGVAALLSGYFAFYAIRLVLESVAYGDVSPGMVPVPLWLPQSSVALGLIIFNVALVDEFVCIARGRDPAYLAIEKSHERSAPGAASREP